MGACAGEIVALAAIESDAREPEAQEFRDDLRRTVSWLVSGLLDAGCRRFELKSLILAQIERWRHA